MCVHFGETLLKFSSLMKNLKSSFTSFLKKMQLVVQYKLESIQSA